MPFDQHDCRILYELVSHIYIYRDSYVYIYNSSFAVQGRLLGEQYFDISINRFASALGLPVPRQPVSSIESSTVRTDLSSTHQLRPRLNGKEVRAEMMDLRSHKLSLGSMGVTSSVNPTGLLRPPLATDIAHTATQSFTDT